MPSIALRYAAMAWISHVIPELHIQDICDMMRRVFQERLLNWIEFGAVYKVLPQYMLSLGRLQTAVEAVLSLSNIKLVSSPRSRLPLLAHHRKDRRGCGMVPCHPRIPSPKQYASTRVGRHGLLFLHHLHSGQQPRSSALRNPSSRFNTECHTGATSDSSRLSCINWA